MMLLRIYEQMGAFVTKTTLKRELHKHLYVALAKYIETKGEDFCITIKSLQVVLQFLHFRTKIVF